MTNPSNVDEVAVEVRQEPPTAVYRGLGRKKTPVEVHVTISQSLAGSPQNPQGTSADPDALSEQLDRVSLRSGPPTKEELLAFYPPKFTWKQLKTFVNSGDLGLLKRNRALQVRYEDWAIGVRGQHGSMVNYLMNHRLQWGKRDTISLLPSTLEDDPRFYVSSDDEHKPPTPYFSIDTPPEYISIIQNDWPYSVPVDVEHTLIWTKVPIFHEDLVDAKVKPRIDQDGVWGFTGKASPPPSPSTLPQCLPALAEWGITLENMITSQKGTEEEEALIRKAGEKVHEYVKERWNEDVWETAWFVNPPRLQSVPGLAHIHVFARRLT